MKTFLFITIAFLGGLMWVTQPKPTEDVNFKKGVWVVQYNASFNKKNDYKWKESTLIKYHYIDLDKYPEFKKASKISTVPTIVIYKNGTETKRFESDLSMQLKVSQVEILKSLPK
jgi:hypothetical protein